MKVINFLISMDFFRIFSNFSKIFCFGFILNLFKCKNIKILFFYTLANVTLDVANEPACHHLYTCHVMHKCVMGSEVDNFPKF